MDEIDNDKLIDLMYETISKQPNGTKFYWSTSILMRSQLIYLVDGIGDSPFDDSDPEFPYLFGIPVQ